VNSRAAVVAAQRGHLVAVLKSRFRLAELAIGFQARPWAVIHLVAMT
jgi:hypothetical protein